MYLRSKNWDTRVAAAQAVEAISENVPIWNPEGLVIKTEGRLIFFCPVMLSCIVFANYYEKLRQSQSVSFHFRF